MRSKGDHKQSKFKHYMAKPIKIFTKARDLYIKSMDDCASKLGYGGGMVGSCPAAPISRLPKSFSVNYSRASKNEGFEEFLEALSKLKMDNGIEVNSEKEVKQGNVDNGGIRRSYSSIGVGLGKMESIDEDRPCFFEEDGMYSRSRSYVAKRYFGHY